jgi:hypothetical protein
MLSLGILRKGASSRLNDSEYVRQTREYNECDSFAVSARSKLDRSW